METWGTQKRKDGDVLNLILIQAQDGQERVSQLGNVGIFQGPLIQTENPKDQVLMPHKWHEHVCTYYKQAYFPRVMLTPHTLFKSTMNCWIMPLFPFKQYQITQHLFPYYITQIVNIGAWCCKHWVTGTDLPNPVAPHWAFDIQDLILQQVATSATEKKLIVQWDRIFGIMYLTDF